LPATPSPGSIGVAVDDLLGLAAGFIARVANGDTSHKRARHVRDIYWVDEAIMFRLDDY
jgi:hypothetical protein